MVPELLLHVVQLDALGDQSVVLKRALEEGLRVLEERYRPSR